MITITQQISSEDGDPKEETAIQPPSQAGDAVEPEPSKEDLGRMMSLAVSAMDSSLDRLRKRALSWRGTTYKDDISIANGTYVTVPLAGILSFSITFEVSVKSLLAYHDSLASKTGK